MKSYLLFAFLFVSVFSFGQPAAVTRNVFIITTDGFRWQEVFKGADPVLIGDTRCVSDTALLRQQYWDDDIEKRRSRLLPFFWNVIARQGQLFGNRDFANDVNVANLYKISYPGYSEIFTGFADRKFIPNLSIRNRNENVLDYLNEQPEYNGQVAAFSSWNVLPYILNEKRNGIPVNSGYEMLEEDPDSVNTLINQVQKNVVHKTNTRHDMLTYASAKTYIEQKHPRVLFLGLGETDEYAHKGEYDHYLQKAHQVDEMIAELWYYVQTDPFYKNNTTFIITTDHGRGRRPGNWNTHGFWISGSGETWMALLGPGIVPEGEIKGKQQLYQSQIAATVSKLLGEHFTSNHSVNAPIPLKPAEETTNRNNVFAIKADNK
ncbi:MAG: alkaline phosphatase family protein [Bacteroidota bacterium]